MYNWLNFFGKTFIKLMVGSFSNNNLRSPVHIILKFVCIPSSILENFFSFKIPYVEK